MDSSLATALITNAGVAGIVVILLVFKVLVPGWYVKKIEQQNEILTRTAERAVSELALSNQLVGELRAIALQRVGSAAAAAALAQGGADGESTALAKEAPGA